jgi:subtilisin family serine protease
MLAGLTGRGIRIAVVDSGVHASHPHVNGIAGGVAIDSSGVERSDVVDRLGHGTAVTAAIREKAPDAELYAVKVFDAALATNVAALVAAIDWAARHGVHLVNLSLGTARAAHDAVLRDAVARAAAAGTVVVSARDDGETATPWLPGSLPGVIAVAVDWSLPRDRYRVADDGAGGVTFHASGFARPIPGVPPERNLHGVSFAVANVTGFAARALESIAPLRSAADLVQALRRAADLGAASADAR